MDFAYDIFGLNSGNAASSYGVYTKEARKQESLIFNRTHDINVCAYCRVSTDKKDQLNSLEAQQDYFNEAFKVRENWKMRTIFADNGISGTSLKNRDSFEQMIREAKAGKYQLIITKSVSRFSRNVGDTITIAEDLRKRGVVIWFMTDRITTDDKDYRKALIAASDAAEAESRAASERVRWGQRYKMQQGVVFGRKEMFGYNIKRDENGKQYFEIIPDEAEIVQQIFRMYANGLGTFKIARRLEEQGVQTKRYKNGWSNTVILKILRNEKYVGDLKQGKTYTTDYLTHQKKYNRGEYATHFAPNHHAESAIISRDLWDIVQKKLEENTLSDEVKQKHSNRYWCSGKVFCGECGNRYISHIKHLKNGGIHKAWKCWANQQYGHKKPRLINGVPVINEETGEQIIVGCDNQSVNDKVLKQGIHDILEQVIAPNMEANYEQLKALILNRKKVNPVEKEIDKKEKELLALEDERTTLIRRMLKLDENDTYNLTAYNAVKDKIDKEIVETQNKISELKNSKKSTDIENAELIAQLDKLKQIVELKDSKISEDIYRNIVKKIEVYDGHILKYYIVGWEPITMQYTTKGKLDAFTVEFTILEE